MKKRTALRVRQSPIDQGNRARRGLDSPRRQERQGVRVAESFC